MNVLRVSAAVFILLVLGAMSVVRIPESGAHVVFQADRAYSPLSYLYSRCSCGDAMSAPHLHP